MLLVSHDSKYLFSTNGACLNVFSVSSGELVYRLSYASNQQETTNESLIIRAICINPTNKFQLLSFHSSGRICLWDYEDGLLLKSFETKVLIKKIIKTESTIYAVGKLKSDSSLSISTTTNHTKQKLVENNHNNYSLFKFYIDDALKNSTEIEHKLILSDLNLNQDKMEIAIDNQGKYVAYIEGTKHIVISKLKKKHSNEMKRIKAKKELTCLAIHPNEDCIAAGTVQGQILLWYNYLDCVPDEEQENNLKVIENKEYQPKNLIKPVKSTLHWHSLPVLCLNFTTEGSFLLSGGHECVLVKWMYKTGSKDFLPRLGAPLNEIICSKDNTLYALNHSDNLIHVIGTNFNILQTFSGFVCPNFAVKKTTNTFYPAGLSYFPRLNCFVTNGRPGHLQFYSHTNDKLLFNLDISDENYISPENLNRPLSQTQIECVAFNHDSTWLATVERRDDSSTTPETRLKFWHYDQTTNKFSLNTLVRQPHSFDRITKIKFKPNENVLFTCGEDGCFKSWILRENRQQASSSETTFNWIYNTCNGFRDMIPTDVEFVSFNSSIDLVAVSFNHITTIWVYNEHEGVIFLNDLIHCDPNDFIRQIKFINNDHLLVMHEKFLNLWSINDTTDQKFLMKCKWSGQYENILYMCENPSDKSQIILLMNESLNSIDDDNKISIQMNIFDLKLDDYLTKAYSFNVYSNSKLNFICLKRSDSEEGEEEEETSLGKSLLNKLGLFYCDNQGVLERITYKTQQSKTACVDVDLTDSMWNNRKTLSKNLPKSNLTNIIDLHKSNKLYDPTSGAQFLIENEKNAKFEANLSKIETTPAYLLPKVGTFCYDILKSMLASYDDNETNNETSTGSKESNRIDSESESSSEDDESEDDRMNGLGIKHQKVSHTKLDQSSLLINKNQRLTNILI